MTNAEITTAIVESNEGDLNNHVMRSCREVSQRMEGLLFSVGGAEQIVTTL